MILNACSISFKLIQGKHRKQTENLIHKDKVYDLQLWRDIILVNI